MLQFPQDVTVDLNVELTNNVINSVHVNQYEHKSREINIYVKKDGIDYPIPNDLTVNIRIHKSNGYDIYKTVGKDIGSINGNIITILIDESMTIASGRQTCDIEFIDSNDNRLYSTKFYINVHKSALDDDNIKDSDDYATIQTWARESKEYANLSKSYAVGTENEVRENDSTDNAKYYKEQAEINASNALEYSEQAESYANDSKSYADNASASAANAARDAQQSASSARQASGSAMTASDKATEAATSATEAESFAHGGTDTRENEDIDNSKYYYEQAKLISESFSGALRPKGTMNFSLFVDTAMSKASAGDMYNISDSFTTNSSFREGSGVKAAAGSNIYKTADGIWDILAGTPVTSVNGQTGDVSITKSSIGLGNVNNTADANKNVNGANFAKKLSNWDDTRNVETTPNDYNGNFMPVGIKAPSASKISNGGLYATLVGIRGWNDSTGGKAHELGFDGNGKLFHRVGSTTTWEAWKEIAHTDSNVASATKATQDGDGNVIADSYVKKDDLNIVIGYDASVSLYARNIAIGYEAESYLTHGTAVGGNTNAGGDGTAIGYGASATGTNCTAIGCKSSASGKNNTAIGYNANSYNAVNNVLQLGENSTLSLLRCNVALSVTSDERDKTDINKIFNATKFLEEVNPFIYTSNQRILYAKEKLTKEEEDNYKKYGFKPYDKEAHERGDNKGERRRAGVSAQQVQKALEKVYGSADYANLVNDNLHDVDPSEIPEGVESQLTVTYENFIPFLISAFNEEHENRVKLEEEVINLNQRLDELESRI